MYTAFKLPIRIKLSENKANLWNKKNYVSVCISKQKLHTNNHTLYILTVITILELKSYKKNGNTLKINTIYHYTINATMYLQTKTTSTILKSMQKNKQTNKLT